MNINIHDSGAYCHLTYYNIFTVNQISELEPCLAIFLETTIQSSQGFSLETLQFIIRALSNFQFGASPSHGNGVAEIVLSLSILLTAVPLQNWDELTADS